MAQSIVEPWITQHAGLHLVDNSKPSINLLLTEFVESGRGQKRSSPFTENCKKQLPDEEEFSRNMRKRQVQENSNDSGEAERNVFSVDNSDVTAEFSAGQTVQVGELSITSGSIFGSFQQMDASTDGCDLKLGIIQCPSEVNHKNNRNSNSQDQLTHVINSEDFGNPGVSLSLSSHYYHENKTGAGKICSVSNISTKTNSRPNVDEDDWLQLRLMSTFFSENSNTNSRSLHTLQLLELGETNRADSNKNSIARKHNGDPLAQTISMQTTLSQPSKLSNLLASQQNIVDQRSNISLISALTSSNNYNQASNSMISGLISGSHNLSKRHATSESFSMLNSSTPYPNMQVFDPTFGFQKQAINPAIMHPSVISQSANIIAMNSQSSRNPTNLMALDFEKLLPSRTGSMTSWISEAIAAGSGNALTRNLSSPIMIRSPGFEPQTFKSSSGMDGKASTPSSILNLNRRSQPVAGLWFALQPESATLPESSEATPFQSISSDSNQQTSYIRIKHGDMPVTTVKKYLATKLALSDQTKVELKCRGKYLEEHISLNDVWDQIWLPFSLKNEFVMVISYKISQD